MKASEEKIARSLEGDWHEGQLFVLQQKRDSYEFCQKQMAESDRQLDHYLQHSEDRSHDAPTRRQAEETAQEEEERK